MKVREKKHLGLPHILDLDSTRSTVNEMSMARVKIILFLSKTFKLISKALGD